jgi:dihydroorotate dehydrogenase (NAD+) catalytic subunit
MAKYGLTFEKPLINAAGSLGFAPDHRSGYDLERLGAFVTNPASPGRRTPAHGTRYLPFSGGFLMHTGYPNPGLKAVLRRYAPQWRRQSLPVWVHLLAQGVDEIAQMVRLLEEVEGVAGLEVGLAADVTPVAAQAFTRAACGELPVVVRLPLERASQLAGGVLDAGAAAISLGPPRGALPDSAKGMVSGRLYGPAIFPLALEMVRSLVRAGVPVIGAGGIYQAEQVQAMLAAGAIAVQLDAVLWRGWQV